jgi:predicted ABC-type exoprotein transport system permease subunit
MKLLKRIATVVFILMSTITIALIAFPFLYESMGVKNAFIACISFGLLIGSIWAGWVLKNKQEDDYRFYHLYKTDDIVETWEKERNREKMKEKEMN